MPPVTTICLLYGAPTSPAGGDVDVMLGDTFGVTAVDFAEGGPVPAALMAATVKVYAVPGVRPVTVWDSAVLEKVCGGWATVPMYGVTT